MKFFIAISVFLLCSITNAHDNKRTIYDSVSGDPIIGVKIIFYLEKDITVFFSDEKGSFFIPDNYDSCFVSIDDKRVKLGKNYLLAGDVSIPVGIYLLSAVKVRDEIYQPGAVDFIVHDHLEKERLNIQKGKTPDEILRQAGCYVKDYGGGGVKTLTFNGYRANDCAVAVDGIPIKNPQNGSSDLSLVGIFPYEGVNIYRSGLSLYQEGALSGQVDMKIKNMDGVSAFMGLGSFGHEREGVFAGDQDKRIKYSLFLSRVSEKGDFNYNRSGKDVKRVNNDTDSYYLYAKFSSNIKNIETKGSVYAVSLDRGSPGRIRGETENARMRDKNVYVRLNALHQCHKLVSKFSVNTGNCHEVYLDNKKNETKHRVKQLDLDYQGIYEGAFLYQTLRLTYKKNTLRSDQALRKSVNRRSVTYSLIHRRFFGPKLSIKGLASWKGTRERGENYSFYRGALSLDYLNSKFVARLFVSGSKDFQFPNLNDLYWDPGGNEDLNTELCRQINCGLEISNRHIKLQGEFYRKNYKELIVWQPVTGMIWSPYNISEARGAGMVLNGTLRPFHFLEGGARWTCQKFDLAPHDSGDLSPVYFPENKVDLYALIRLYMFSMTFSGNYTDRVYYSHDNTLWLPAFWVYDVSALAKYGVFSLNVSVLNLLDKEYQSIAHYPMPGRNYRFLLTFNW